MRVLKGSWPAGCDSNGCDGGTGPSIVRVRLAIIPTSPASDSSPHSARPVCSIPTSGILPKNAFSVESCMAFKENNSDHFQSNGLLLTYGVTDWLETGLWPDCLRP